MRAVDCQMFSGFNPIALRKAKTLWSFGRSECSRVEHRHLTFLGSQNIQ